MKTANTIELKFIFTSPGRAKPVLKDIVVRSLEEMDDFLILASAWAEEKEGRKAHVFAPGYFSTNTVDGILNWWIPNKGQAMLAHMPEFTPEPELDYAI